MVARRQQGEVDVDLSGTLSEGGLLAIAAQNLPESDLRSLSVERLGHRLPTIADPGGMHLADAPYWASLKREFRTLFCTDDPRYASLRSELQAAAKNADKAVVAAIAAAVASFVGLAASALASFVAILLLAMLKLGTEGFCGMQALEIKPG
jgi:hypothetical protein